MKSFKHTHIIVGNSGTKYFLGRHSLYGFFLEGLTTGRTHQELSLKVWPDYKGIWKFDFGSFYHFNRLEEWGTHSTLKESTKS